MAEGPTDGTGDGIGEHTGDGAADDTCDCPGDDTLAASTDKARDEGADDEGDLDGQEEVTWKPKLVSCFWSFIAQMCWGCLHIHANFAAMSGPWEWTFLFP